MSRDLYFEYLLFVVDSNMFSGGHRYNKLLRYLYNKEFTYTIKRDGNRKQDALSYRYNVCNENKIDIPDKPASVLEVMIALANRLEQSIMGDDDYGDRTNEWFWSMIVNLQLGGMHDEAFDISYVDKTVNDFLNREYLPNGIGSLFYFSDPTEDIRKVEIWYQALWWINTLE